MPATTEKLVESKIFTLIARGCMIASVPVLLWIASQVAGWLDKYTAAQNAKFKEVTDKVDKVNETVNLRVDGVNTRLSATDQSVQTINTTIAVGLQQTIEQQGKRIESLERQTDNLRERLDTERDRVTGLVGDVKLLGEMSKLQSPRSSQK